MKKKPLLFALLALAIVTSLAAGTLAIYTKKVDLAGDVQVKKFAFDAKGGNGTEVTSVKLAPTESQTTDFEVTNYEKDSPPAEVDLDYVITVDIQETAKTMIGLRAELLGEDGNPLSVLVNASGTVLTYKGKLDAGTPDIDTYKVKLTWAHDAGANNDNKEQTDVGIEAKTFTKGLKITVTATQATGN